MESYRCIFVTMVSKNLYVRVCLSHTYILIIERMHSTQLREIQEEMKTKESRWGSSLARYRLRIETLETQNKELQNDLHMMEQERLKQWQLQVLKCIVISFPPGLKLGWVIQTHFINVSRIDCTIRVF